MSRRGRSLALAAALAASIVARPCLAEPGDLPSGVSGPAPGRYAEAQALLPASFAAGTVARYRFSSGDPWKAFDRPLYLSAFQGEDRRYELEFLAPGAVKPELAVYVIDRLAPEPPAFTTPSGDVEAFLSVRLEGESRLFVSLDGSGFSEYAPASPASFSAPVDGTSIVVAHAYAMDELGNASRTVSARWRLRPMGFEPSFSAPPAGASLSLQVEAAVQGLHARLEDAFGSARLSVEAPADCVPVAAVNAAAPHASTSAYVQLSASNAGTVFIPFPWGYGEEIVVHYGYRKGDALVVAAEPLRLVPSFMESAASAPPSRPLAPTIRADGETALVEWPENPWLTVVSVNGGAYEPYAAPLVVSLGDESVSLSYYALGPDGTRSAEAVATLPQRRRAVVPRLSGVEQGGRYGPFALALPPAGQRVRYELAEADASPATLSADSPVMGPGGLRLEGRQGEVVRYALRLAAEVGGETQAEERILRFSVDREAPPVPRLRDRLGSYSSDDAVLSFEPTDGIVFVSVSENGTGPFARYEGPITMAGSDEGRRRYVVRAYAEDEFGNRSLEASPLRITIDRSSLYVDAKGRAGATGSPGDPMPRLDDAIEAAQASGKRFICVRGPVVLTRAATIRSRLTIAGGYDDEWNEAPERRASVSAAASASYAFLVKDAELVLRRLDLRVSGDSSPGLVSASGGAVAVEASRLYVEGGLEKTALRLAGASLRLEGSSVELSGCVTGRGVDLSSAALTILDSSIGCGPTTRMFEGVRLSEATATIAGLRIEASPSLAVSALSASSSTIVLERSILSLAGGASSCRAIGAQATSLTARSVYLELTGKGVVEAFSASAGSRLDVAHVSAFLQSPRSAFMSSSASSLTLRNSIVNASGGEAVLLRTDSPLAPGSVAANCLWGFGIMIEGRPYPSPVREVSGLNILAGPPGLTIVESPSTTFRGLEKGLRRLSRSSACVDSGLTLEGETALDLFGSPRRATPDRGAEELP